MIRLVLTALFLGGLCSQAYAGPKEDLIKAIVEQCKLPQADAEKLATPGRTGTIMQFNLCSKSVVEVSDSCKVSCKKQGSTIGG